MTQPRRPIVVQYLYVHDPDEAFWYPSVRSHASAARVAVRYLECALTQAASLRLRDVDCDLVLATNMKDRRSLGRDGARMVDALERLDVEILHTEYRHRPPAGTKIYVSSRYLLDAILSASDGQPADRQMWFTDLDCVWADAQRVFACAPPPGEIGCIYIGYPPDWDTIGFGEYGLTRRAIGELAEDWDERRGVPPWVGGELLAGAPGDLRELVRSCDELDASLAREGKTLPNEEQVLSLAGATGRARFRDLSAVARRMPTGPRTEAVGPEDPLSIGFWHLPSEKGLSLRRTARAVSHGRLTRVRRDLADPVRAAKRFNVAGTGLARRVRDDGWIASRRVETALRSGLERRSTRVAGQPELVDVAAVDDDAHAAVEPAAAVGPEVAVGPAPAVGPLRGDGSDARERAA